MKLRPLHDRVLIEPIPEKDVTDGGIYIPDTARIKTQKGVVSKVGQGRIIEDGKIIPTTLKEGEIVYFPRTIGYDIPIDGKNYLILRESDIEVVEEE